MSFCKVKLFEKISHENVSFLHQLTTFYQPTTEGFVLTSICE